MTLRAYVLICNDLPMNFIQQLIPLLSDVMDFAHEPNIASMRAFSLHASRSLGVHSLSCNLPRDPRGPTPADTTLAPLCCTASTQPKLSDLTMLSLGFLCPHSVTLEHTAHMLTRPSHGACLNARINGRNLDILRFFLARMSSTKCNSSLVKLRAPLSTLNADRLYALWLCQSLLPGHWHAGSACSSWLMEP